MAVLAAPLVIPFAEALGLSVAILGMDKVSDKVNQFIKDNPEESMKIFQMIMPAQGIANALKNKSSEEVEEKISLEDLEGMSDEEAQDLSKEDKAELMKQGGKSKSKDKRQTMIDISEKLGLSGEGKDKQDIEYEIDERYDEGGVEEVSKPKFDYTKFFRKRRADGGSIGIEVLFEPKRKDFSIGGRAKPTQTFDPRASAVDYATALDKVGAGTAAQKRQSLSDYLGNVISTQGQKLGNAAVIPLQAAKGVLGIQGTPITDSMQASLQNIIQKQIKDSGKLSGNLNYLDYGVLTDRKGQEFLGFGDRSFTDPEAALATTLGKASYAVDPKTGKITFTGGTAYDFGDDQFGGLGKFISKGGVFSDQATQYNPDITLGSDFMKQFNQPKYPDYKTAALQSQYYKNNPSLLDSDLFRAAYARALPGSGIKTSVTKEGRVFTDYGNYDPSRTYSAYMSNRGTSSSNPFFDQFKGSQYADMPAIMKAMYGDPGNLNPYYADGGRVGLFMGGDPLTGQALAIYNSMNSYGFTDQQIADALQGQGLYTPGGTTTPNAPTTIQPVGLQTGNDNFSPFNPDPNKIKSVRQDPKIQANLEAIQRSQALEGMGIQDPFASEGQPGNEYYGDMMEIDLSPGKQSMFAKAKQGLSGAFGKVKGLMDNPVMNAMSFAVNPLIGGVKGIASFANKMLPTSTRGFAENAAGNLGIFVDDIGRIVNTGDYMDPNNIMAGYNLNMINANTFQKRIDRIRRGRLSEEKKQQRIDIIREAQRKIEAAQKLARLQAEQANLAKGRAPSGGKFDDGRGGAYTGPGGLGGGQFTDSMGNVDYQDPYDPGGGEKDGGIIGYKKGGLATMFKEKR